jgi:hypothetical protein
LPRNPGSDPAPRNVARAGHAPDPRRCRRNLLIAPASATGQSASLSDEALGCPLVPAAVETRHGAPSRSAGDMVRMTPVRAGGRRCGDGTQSRSDAGACWAACRAGCDATNGGMRRSNGARSDAPQTCATGAYARRPNVDTIPQRRWQGTGLVCAARAGTCRAGTTHGRRAAPRCSADGTCAGARRCFCAEKEMRYEEMAFYMAHDAERAVRTRAFFGTARAMEASLLRKYAK